MIKTAKRGEFSMRLTGYERKMIKETARNVFGPEVKIFLFGSRTDNALKGGDIDLFIETENQTSLQDKISFISKLKWDLGDQKIDVLVSSPGKKQKKIYAAAKQKGLEL
jgi:uncharacterized protein